MRKLAVPVEKINSLAAVLYLVGLSLYFWLAYPDMWEAIIIITGAVWLIRQFLVGRILDCFFVILIFGLSWASYTWLWYPYWVIPGLLAVGAVYLIINQVVRYWRRLNQTRNSPER